MSPPRGTSMTLLKHTCWEIWDWLNCVRGSFFCYQDWVMQSPLSLWTTCWQYCLVTIIFNFQLQTCQILQRLVASFCKCSLSFLTTQSTFSMATKRHGVEHHISTTGLPVCAHARCLDSLKLAVAKAEFAYMGELGIVQCSNNPESQWCHNSCLLSCSASSRFLSMASLQKHFLQSWLCARLPTSASPPGRYSKNCCCHPFWIIWVHVNAVWPEKCHTLLRGSWTVLQGLAEEAMLVHPLPDVAIALTKDPEFEFRRVDLSRSQPTYLSHFTTCHYTVLSK